MTEQPSDPSPERTACECRKALEVYADSKNWVCPRCLNADNPDPINCGMMRWIGPGEHGYETASAALNSPCSGVPGKPGDCNPQGDPQS